MLLALAVGCSGNEGEAGGNPDPNAPSGPPPVVCDEGSVDLGAASEPNGKSVVLIESIPFDATGNEEFRSQPTTLCFPNDIISFSLTLIGDGDGPSPVTGLFIDLEDPSGERLIDASSLAALNESPLRQTVSPTLGVPFASVHMPQTPDVRPRGGNYVVSAATDQAGDYDLQVIMRRGETPEVARLPVNVIVVGETIPDEATIASVNQAINLASLFLERENIELELTAVGVADVEDAALEVIEVPFSPESAVTNTPLALVDAERTERPETPLLPAPALNLYFVKEILLEQPPNAGQNDLVVLGLSLGAPGGYLENHGVFLSVDAHRVTVQGQGNIVIPDFLASTLAHEASHWLGLYHTSELNGGLHDQTEDTPECTAARDANNDGVVQPGECQGAGSNNYMFWTVDPQAATLSDMVISAEQGAALRENPVVLLPESGAS